MKARLIYEHIDYLNDVRDIPCAFSPYFIIDDNSEHFLKWQYSYKDAIFSIHITSDIFENKSFSCNISNEDILEYKRKTKFFIKNALYIFLRDELQITLPYGSLTGVRPTKLYYELEKKTEDTKQFLVQNYHVSEEKAHLISECVKNQRQYINTDEKNIGLFINIPFCPSRCKYCSFISTEIFRIKKKLGYYVECLRKELDSFFEICEKKGYNVRSIYIGGGTPTSIGAENLQKILEPLLLLAPEFTVEAGRPDAITEDVVSALSKCGVTRVSVNPQTFCNRTLELVGRQHTVEDFYRTFYLMKNAGFSVNTDLIAGLPQESVEIFRNSVDRCIELRPDNITIHTLSIKRGATFSTEGMEKEEFGKVEEMINYAHLSLNAAEYLPYYMYRQKNMADNLENTGYTLPGKQCTYNIDMMEEASGIIGLGAGSMSKIINGNKISRFSTPKGFNEYCDRIEHIIDAKKKFFAI